MAANAPLPPGGDMGMDQDNDLAQDVEDLEARVSAIEQRLGIQPPPDTDDAQEQAIPLKAALAGTKGAFGS